MTKNYIPRVIALELTRSCNLSCKHCRAGAQNKNYKNELTTLEWKNILDEISEINKAVVILTGGDPMLRDDLYDLSKYGDSLGLKMVMASCGPNLNKETVKKIKEAKIAKISVSIDSSDYNLHDNFRGVPGIMERTLNGIQFAKEGKLPFQINTTITKNNLNELDKILNMVIEIGAESWDAFLLVPTGRGKDLIDEVLSPPEYENALYWFYNIQKSSPIPVKLTCAPHFNRIKVEKGDKSKKFKACMGGETFAFISHTGNIQICGFLDISCGNAKKDGFINVWKNSEILKKIRSLEYKGKCGTCSYLKICGGCRARAYAFTGDYLQSEPFCNYISGK